MLDSRIIDRLYELDLSDEEIVLISYMYDNGDITEENIFNIGDDEVFDIEKVGEYELNNKIDSYEDNYGLNVSYNGEDWYVFLDEDSAFEAAVRDCLDYMNDEGITGINFKYIGGLDNFLNTEWFENTIRESEENYCWDISNEGDNIYDNRLAAECYDEGLIDDSDFEEDEDGEPDYTQCLVTDEELVKKYVGLMMSRIVDYVEEYKLQFGEDDFNDVVIEKELVDLDDVARACVDHDGIAHTLARYDNEEVTYDFNGNEYYMYRNN